MKLKRQVLRSSKGYKAVCRVKVSQPKSNSDDSNMHNSVDCYTLSCEVSSIVLRTERCTAVYKCDEGVFKAHF